VGCIADVSSVLFLSILKVVGVADVEVFGNVETAVHIYKIPTSKERINICEY
jgi:hypothetical protein